MPDKFDSKTIDWLLEGDPSVRWQVQRDLLMESPESVQDTRKLMTTKGWGKRLLNEQDQNGGWGGGLYGPKWISTHYTLICLARLGLPSGNKQAQDGCRYYLENTFYEPDGGINIHATYDYSETCVTGMAIFFFSHFKLADSRLNRLVEHLLSQQMVDGGWNCESYKGATHSSFHTTISVLEGLLSYQDNISNDKLITSARERAHEFLLQHSLYKSHRTGEVVDQRMTRFPFPPRWFYDILRALDYFQAAKASYDPRFIDAIEVLKKKQTRGGLWVNYRGMSGRIFFELEPAGKPGRVNTMRALRALKWWDSIQENNEQKDKLIG
jgi:hypothetical protein